MIIGGNTFLTIKQKTVGEFNAYGERVNAYETVAELEGWIDMESGTSEYSKYSKIPDTTHVFVSDYVNLSVSDLTELRAVHGLDQFDVLYIDNPIGMNRHLEIFLRQLT